MNVLEVLNMHTGYVIFLFVKRFAVVVFLSGLDVGQYWIYEPDIVFSLLVSWITLFFCLFAFCVGF